MGAVGFALRSAANDSADAFTGGGMRKINTFDSFQQLTTTLKNSVAPLLNNSNLSLLKKFDSMVSKDVSFRDTLAELAHKVGDAVPSLTAAQAMTDPVKQQVEAIIALQKSGVARNFMLTVPWADTNGGGNLTTKGGSRNLDPFSATPLIAQAMVALHKAIPNLVIVTTSDGGRSANNGDQSAGFAIISRPDTVFANGILGGSFASTDQLGRNFTSVALSNNTTGVARPAQWYATALKGMGLDSKIEHVPQALIVAG